MWMQPNTKQLNDIKTMVKNASIRSIWDLIYSIEDRVDAYEYCITF
jgi:hypothetical protein